VPGLHYSTPSPEEGKDVNAHDREGETPLIYAGKGRHVQVVRQLLEVGADPNGSGNSLYISPVIT
jgi:ankyrin repeat protein